jgi:hypothetical protein
VDPTSKNAPDGIAEATVTVHDGVPQFGTATVTEKGDDCSSGGALAPTTFGVAVVRPKYENAVVIAAGGEMDSAYGGAMNGIVKAPVALVTAS